MTTHDDGRRWRQGAREMAGRVVHPPPSHRCVFVISAWPGLTSLIQVSRLELRAFPSTTWTTTRTMATTATTMVATTTIIPRVDDKDASNDARLLSSRLPSSLLSSTQLGLAPLFLSLPRAQATMPISSRQLVPLVSAFSPLLPSLLVSSVCQ